MMTGNTVLGGEGQAEVEGDLTMPPLNPRAQLNALLSAHLKYPPPQLSWALKQNVEQALLEAE